MVFLGNNYVPRLLSHPTLRKNRVQTGVPKNEIPDEFMAPDSAYQLIADELLLDGSPGLKMATFVNTYEDEWGRKLAFDNLDNNCIDHEEYPKSSLAEKRSI